MIRKLSSALLFVVGAVLLTSAQVLMTGSQKKEHSGTSGVVFAVTRNGGVLEPIVSINDGELGPAIDGASQPETLKAFHDEYFKPKASYPLIFAGTRAGTVTIKSADPESECSRHTAEVTVASTRTRLKGNVMGLAVSGSFKVPDSGLRRAPTASERAEIERLVRAEFAANKVPIGAIRRMRNVNLTAIDVENDDLVELVGTFSAAPTPKSRALLFFITERDNDGHFALAVKEYRRIEEKETMSEDITSIDSGVLQELLLDVFDYNGDGVGEVFTHSPSFEGTGFNIYRRTAGKWTKAFEGANYRCGF